VDTSGKGAKRQQDENGQASRADGARRMRHDSGFFFGQGGGWVGEHHCPDYRRRR
jgi:hypothetical protein